MNEILSKLKHQGTQVELAKEFGVSQSAIAQWFRRKKIPPARCLKVSKMIGVPVEKVLEEVSE